MKTLEEKKREKETVEAWINQVADYINFMESEEEELKEEELELVTAAASETPYARFLKRLEKK